MKKDAEQDGEFCWNCFCAASPKTPLPNSSGALQSQALQSGYDHIGNFIVTNGFWISAIRLKVSTALNTGILDPNNLLINDVIRPIRPATTPNTKAIKYFTIGNINAKICAA